LATKCGDGVTVEQYEYRQPAIQLDVRLLLFAKIDFAAILHLRHLAHYLLFLTGDFLSHKYDINCYFEIKLTPIDDSNLD